MRHGSFHRLGVQNAETPNDELYLLPLSKVLQDGRSVIADCRKPQAGTLYLLIALLQLDRCALQKGHQSAEREENPRDLRRTPGFVQRRSDLRPENRERVSPLADPS